MNGAIGLLTVFAGYALFLLVIWCIGDGQCDGYED